MPSVLLLILQNPVTKDWCVNIIGEKNLEYEVEENYAEVTRLLISTRHIRKSAVRA